MYQAGTKIRRSQVRRNWLFVSRLILLLFDFIGVIVYALVIKDPSKITIDANSVFNHREIKTATLIIARLGFSLVNGLFLSTYGFYHTDTVIGSFFYQQFIYYPIVLVLLPALALKFQLKEQDPYYQFIYGDSWQSHSFFRQSWQLIPLIVREGCDFLVVIALWCFLCGVTEFKHRKLSCLVINIDELASGIRSAPDQSITWRGRPRRRRMSRLQARVVGSTMRFLYNGILRRVIPVETRIQALIQHIFSLAAIVLLIVRVAYGIGGLNENLPSRTTVEPCDSDQQDIDSLQVYTRVPPDDSLDFLNLTLGHAAGSIRERLAINVSSVHDCQLLPSTSTPFLTNPCSPNLGRRRDLGAYTYYTFTCDARIDCGGGIPGNAMGYEYTVQLHLEDIISNDWLNTNYYLYNLAKTYMPVFWLAPPQEIEQDQLMTPFLTQPIQPEFGWYKVFKTHFSLKKSITSSPLWEIVTGSDPSYDTKFLYPSTFFGRELIQTNSTDASPDARLRATGLIYTPDFLDASEQTPTAEASKWKGQLCEVTEEYRLTTGFELLASIGGLLALLQGIHVLIFGRPLFWGLFGAKLIAPFGLAGALATKDFKKRLQARYHYQMELQDAESGLSCDTPPGVVGINMTQFLLDYVIDLGPASVPSPHRKEIEIESTDSEDEGNHTPAADVEGASQAAEPERTSGREAQSRCELSQRL
ncbi:unnamed protein product [Rhizoctonia solani]|uniref:Uncharacterized protein n=1 Tax=Rhizoctonia solani TaxID=456999 RepID=A0A8H3DZZ5_9AGAM|nr:unnamed protein product [Rhizoctonia solani]